LKKKIITQNNFLGLRIYTRTRISNEGISIKNNYENQFLLGLYALTKYSKLEFNTIPLQNHKDWDNTTIELFYKAFFHLLFTRTIEIYVFTDKQSFLGLFKSDLVGYQVKIKKYNTHDDIFLNLVLKSIKETNAKFRDKSELKHIVEHLIDEFLVSKTREYNNPEKKFNTRLLKRYARKYSWLELEKEKKYLGLVTNYKVKIDEVRLNPLKDSFRELSTISRKEKLNNVKLGVFERKLSALVLKDFKKRVPSSDNDID
jgi:hypothetical protein